MEFVVEISMIASFSHRLEEASKALNFSKPPHLSTGLRSLCRDGGRLGFPAAGFVFSSSRNPGIPRGKPGRSGDSLRGVEVANPSYLMSSTTSRATMLVTCSLSINSLVDFSMTSLCETGARI